MSQIQQFAVPLEAMSLYDDGVRLHLAGQIAEALANYEKALALAPDYPQALNNRGAALQQLGQFDEALVCYERALALTSDFLDPLKNRAVALQALKQHADAVAAYDALLALDPGADVQGDRGAALLELRRFEEALAGFDRALGLRPAHSPTLSNRGLALQGLRRYDEARETYLQATAADPRSAPAWTNLGFLMKELGREAEAIGYFDKAIEIESQHAVARTNRGICLLVTGDYERGWEEAEWRWKSPNFPSKPRNFAKPLWLGQKDLAGKTILLHAEQGLGDTLQFVRYVPMVAQLGAKVILEAPPVLKPLLTGLAGVTRIVTEGEVLPAFDFHCPLLSLALAFATRLDNVPAAIPYLAPSKSGAEAWRARLATEGRKLVGLSWRGSPTYRNDRDRSVSLAELQPLLRLPGLRFVSLQKEMNDDELRLTKGLEHFVHPGADFQTTADIVEALDLVISVDTVWAHWAGAIGKPFWLLLPHAPHWCWLLERNDSPWYPSARIFRQSRSADWPRVVQEVVQGLRGPM